MWTCPVCGHSADNSICERCGFDRSTDLITYPTLMVPQRLPGIHWRQKEPLNHTVLLCPDCKGAEFQLSSLGPVCLCVRCGRKIPTEQVLKVQCLHATPSTPVNSPEKRLTDIVSICAGAYHTLCLRANGTVIATGKNKFGECDVEDWTQVAAIAAGYAHTVAPHRDGSVSATGETSFKRCDVQNWKQITAVSAGEFHTLGLRKDGTVAATGKNFDNQCNVQSWAGITAIAAGEKHSVGLRKDGTAVAVGDNRYGQCNVSKWTDIIAIAAGDQHTLGLRKDGTLVATGRNSDMQCALQDLMHNASKQERQV